MRINVYSQELTSECQRIQKESNTGIVYSGVQIMLHSSPMLHHPPKDDDCLPTIFNYSRFDLTQDDNVSLREMEAQAIPGNNVTHDPGSLLRLDQFCVHRVSEAHMPTVRTFLKLSFSPDRYDLVGNTHNYLIDYDWPMRERGIARNIPQQVQHSEPQS
jgi:hypothetical protein